MTKKKKDLIPNFFLLSKIKKPKTNEFLVLEYTFDTIDVSGLDEDFWPNFEI